MAKIKPKFREGEQRTFKPCLTRINTFKNAYTLASLGASRTVLENYCHVDKNIELKIELKLKLFRAGNRWILTDRLGRLHANIIYRMYITTIRENAELHRMITAEELIFLASTYLKQYQMKKADANRIHYMFVNIREGIWCIKPCVNCGARHVYHCEDDLAKCCPFCENASRLFLRSIHTNPNK